MLVPKRVAFACLCMAATGLAASPASAQSVAEFYKNRTIKMIIGAGAGGGNDVYARLLARHMGSHIPGKPSITVQNMPGAGSRIAASFLYNKAPRDGSVIGAVTRVLPMDPLITGRKVQFDALKFNWLGSLNKSTNILITWHTAPTRTLDDVFRKETIVAAAGAGTDGVVYPKLINNLLGGKFKIVAGYPGSSAMMLAMERGEVHGRGGVPWSTIVSRHLDWYKAKKINVLAQLALAPDPELPGVPMLLDRVKDPTHRKAFELLFSRQEMGRPYVAPPALPGDRADALRKAFTDTASDPTFRAAAKRQKLLLNVLSGDQVAALVREAYATPKATLDLVKRLLSDKGGLAKCAEYTAAEKCRKKKKKRKKKTST